MLRPTYTKGQVLRARNFLNAFGRPTAGVSENTEPPRRKPRANDESEYGHGAG